MCEASVCARQCNKCFALCFRRASSFAYLSESLGGPEFNLISNKSMCLPNHIPVIPDRLPSSLMKFDIVGINGQHAFARNGGKVNKGYLGNGFARALNINVDAKGILEFYVKDRTLEGFWDNRKEIYKQLRELSLTGIIAPNYSVYEDAPRLDHLYNIKRSTIVYNEMMEYGLKAIPDVSWYNIRDLEEWCKEIKRQHIRVIAFSFQVVDIRLKTSNEWHNSLSGFRYLCQNTPQDTKIIIAGLVSPLRIMEVVNATRGQSIHVLNQSAYVQSRHGILSSTRAQVKDRHYLDLLGDNVSYFDHLYQEMNQLGNKEQDIFSCLRSWDAAKVRTYCLDYITGPINDIELRYGIEQCQAEMVFSIVKRRIRRKKLSEE